MVWVALKGWDLSALSILERASNLMPPEGKGHLLFQYSLEEFSGQHIMMAAELHTHTIYKGKIEKSPYY